MISYYIFNNIKNKLIKGLKNKAGRNFQGRDVYLVEEEVIKENLDL